MPSRKVAGVLTGHTAILVLSVCLSSCRGEGDGTILHPTNDNIPVITDPRFVLHEQESDTGTVGPWFDLPDLAEHVIGVEEGAKLETIGLVADVTVGHGALYYADRLNAHVRVYDFRGALMEVVGNRGRGPGEFLRPTKVAVTHADDGELLVVGDYSSKIQVYRRQDSTYALENTFRTAQSFYYGDICAMHGHVYIVGHSEVLDGVIHKYTFEGEHVASFGMPYQSSEPLVRELLNGRGTLACNAKYRVIAHVHSVIPVLTGYSESGDVNWRVKFGDAKTSPIEEGRTDDGRPRVRPNPLPRIGEAAQIDILAGTWSDALIVTYYTVVGFKTGKHHYFRVDVTSGQGTHLGWSPGWNGDIKQPSVVALDAEHFYTVKNDPYPRIGIYRRPDSLP